MQFDVNDIYIAKSQKTGKPYVDADKTVHIFLSAADAEHFKKMLRNSLTVLCFLPRVIRQAQRN